MEITQEQINMINVVLNAHKEGIQVQYNNAVSSEWEDSNAHIEARIGGILDGYYKYRVKPELVYAPLERCDIKPGTYLKFSEEGVFYLIGKIGVSCVYFDDGTVKRTYDQLFENKILISTDLKNWELCRKLANG